MPVLMLTEANLNIIHRFVRGFSMITGLHISVSCVWNQTWSALHLQMCFGTLLRFIPYMNTFVKLWFLYMCMYVHHACCGVHVMGSVNSNNNFEGRKQKLLTTRLGYKICPEQRKITKIISRSNFHTSKNNKEGLCLTHWHLGDLDEILDK